ncbi:MAG TPA: HAMP domain-containing sensor histidine kinase [Thermoanaerobaculia bacterium]
MVSRPFVLLASVTLVGLIAIASLSGRSARVLAGAIDSQRQWQSETVTTDQEQEQASPAAFDARVESARRFAIYGPWGMCLFALIMLASLLVRLRTTLARAHEAGVELQRAVHQEQMARQGAEEADHMKDQFLATVSHELRSPLTSIIGWCSLLSEEDARQTLLQEGLASIAQAARVQSQLVEDLLDVSRIIAGKLEPQLADVDPVEVVQAAIASVAPSARTKNIRISMLVEGQPARLRADAIRLEQVVWNLLSNAIKFTPQNGSIDVALRWRASSLQIAIADTGEGIGPDLLPHIFDRFRQGHASGMRTGGLGLGLSIVKSLVELHSGSVRAESAGPGAGATFIVELPLANVSRREVPFPIGRLFIARHSTPDQAGGNALPPAGEGESFGDCVIRGI